MPLWGKNDAASNAAIFAAAQLNKTANVANRTALYGNTTSDSFVTNTTKGQFAASDAEMATNSAGLASITVTAAGTGYTVRPTVAVAAPNITGVTATATSVGILVSTSVTARGSGYAPAQVLTILGGTGTSATTTVTNTEVNTITVAAGGTGYANGQTITVTGGTGTSATATVTTGAADTIVATLTPVNRGDYTVNPSLAAVATTGGAGSGLTVNLTIGAKTLSITNAGAYTVLPTLTNNGVTGGGTGATVNLVIGAGPATITEAGTGYTSAPVITFGGAGGVGSTATAALKLSETAGIAHSGWHLRTVGTGGRAGRVQYECLVACGIVGDGTDNAVIPN